MKPPERIPLKLMDAYTMHGKIPVGYRYADNTCDVPQAYTEQQINALIAKAFRRERNYYALDSDLFRALDAYPIRGHEVAIMGSLVPWYEAVCLERGAQPYTIEYNPVDYQHAAIKSFTSEDYWASKPRKRFPFALSISSFEHDGLGRYGDPLNPNGDLEAMAKMKQVLEPGGIMFLSLPVGQDKLAWNVHRVYGETRLPLLLHGWRCLATFGLDVFKLPGENWTQPVFVLQA